MERDLARILDANFNRAREGLRVAEEYARFVVEDLRLAGQAKHFRHALAAAATALDPRGEMLFARDTAGDVGTTLAGTSARLSAADVATAAAKRVGEALRVLCEYAKPVNLAVAAELDQVRYRFYDWEKTVAGAADRRRFARVRLYLLLTAQYCRTGDWQATARAAIDGGVDAIQLREKDLDDSDLLARASWLADTCRAAGVLSIVNDRPDIAWLSRVDGVHVGRRDMPVSAARRIVQPQQLIGTSTHSPGELDEALACGPDYVALGPMFASCVKPDYGVAGVGYARPAIAKLDAAGVPHVAIGGITVENVGQLAAAGVRCVAACTAILAADNVAAAARSIKSSLQFHQAS